VVVQQTLDKEAVTVTWRRDDDFSLSSTRWHSIKYLSSAQQKILGKEVIAEVQFTEIFLSRVKLSKKIVESFLPR
jgi:hypothetical protein